MISILTRAGADASPVIADLTLCLASQSDFDFEWILLLRPGFAKYESEFRKLLDAYPKLAVRSRLIKTETDSRGELLNIGLTHAKGSHIVVVDDDELVLSNFISIFNSAADIDPNVSKSFAVRTIPSRKVVGVCCEGHSELVSESRTQFPWPSEFSVQSHLLKNETPCCAIAWPRDVIVHFNVRWDANLTVAEDWDFLLRMIAIVEVRQLPETTSIYRIWKVGSRSTIQVDKKHWRISEKTIRSRLFNYGIIVDQSKIGAFSVQMSPSDKIVQTAFNHIDIFRKSRSLYQFSRFIYHRFFRNRQK